MQEVNEVSIQEIAEFMFQTIDACRTLDQIGDNLAQRIEARCRAEFPAITNDQLEAAFSIVDRKVQADLRQHEANAKRSLAELALTEAVLALVAEAGLSPDEPVLPALIKLYGQRGLEQRLELQMQKAAGTA
jgi:hypothetical protein